MPQSGAQLVRASTRISPRDLAEIDRAAAADGGRTRMNYLAKLLADHAQQLRSTKQKGK